MHVFISGSSGVGKTAVINELAERGYAAFDTDHVPGLARLELSATGEPVDWPESGYIDWEKYAWNIQAPVFEELITNKNDLILSGICHNQAQFYDKFDRLIVLTVAPEEYLRRMRERPYRGANDDEINIKQRVNRYATKLQQFIDAGFTPVSNTGSPAKTADEILRIAHAG